MKLAGISNGIPGETSEKTGGVREEISAKCLIGFHEDFLKITGRFSERVLVIVPKKSLEYFPKESPK